MRPRSRFRATATVVLGLSLLLTACGGGVDAAVTPDSITADDATAPSEPPADGAVDASGDVEPVAQPAEDTVVEPTPTSPADADTAAPVPAPADEVAGDCSAQGATVEVVPAPELPADVAELRALLIDAALRCDEQLLFTAIEESEQFTYSFGDTGDALGHWWQLEEAGDEPFLRLAQVLATTPSLADGGDIVVWPRVSTGRPEDATADAWAEVTWMTDAQEQAANAGGYLGWRVGISTDGQWRFFVAGD